MGESNRVYLYVKPYVAINNHVLKLSPRIDKLKEKGYIQ